MKYFVGLLFVMFLAACAPKQSPKTIYLVRHAEKQLTGDDPELSIAGKARATKLAQLLEDKEIKHVLSTDYIRTRATAAPTATAAAVDIVSYSSQNMPEFVRSLKQMEGNILVVGHSNTISKIANEFVQDGNKFEDLDESEYNIIYEVLLSSEGSAVTVKSFKNFNSSF